MSAIFCAIQLWWSVSVRCAVIQWGAARRDEWRRWSRHLKLRARLGTGAERGPSDSGVPTGRSNRRQELRVSGRRGTCSELDGIRVGHNLQCLSVPCVYHHLDLVFWYTRPAPAPFSCALSIVLTLAAVRASTITSWRSLSYSRWRMSSIHRLV